MSVETSKRASERRHWRGMDRKHALVALATIGIFGDQARRLLDQDLPDGFPIKHGPTLYLLTRVDEIPGWNLITL